jgi:hypothetical protein
MTNQNLWQQKLEMETLKYVATLSTSVLSCYCTLTWLWFLTCNLKKRSVATAYAFTHTMQIWSFYEAYPVHIWVFTGVLCIISLIVDGIKLVKHRTELLQNQFGPLYFYSVIIFDCLLWSLVGVYMSGAYNTYKELQPAVLVSTFMGFLLSLGASFSEHKLNQVCVFLM